MLQFNAVRVPEVTSIVCYSSLANTHPVYNIRKYAQGSIMDLFCTDLSYRALTLLWAYTIPACTYNVKWWNTEVFFHQSI